MCHANHNRLPPLAFFCFNDDQNSECPAMASAGKSVDYTALQAAPGGTAGPGAGTEQRALTGAEYAEQRELREAQQHILSGRALVVDLLTESRPHIHIHSLTHSLSHDTIRYEVEAAPQCPADTDPPLRRRPAPATRGPSRRPAQHTVTTTVTVTTSLGNRPAGLTLSAGVRFTTLTACKTCIPR